MSVSNILVVAQTVCLAATIVLILIQNRGAGLSSAFGGSNQIYLTRRGIEKWVTNFTVIFIAAFVVLRIASFYIG